MSTPPRKWGSGPGGYLGAEPPGREAAQEKAWLWSMPGSCGGVRDLEAGRRTNCRSAGGGGGGWSKRGGPLGG